MEFTNKYGTMDYSARDNERTPLFCSTDHHEGPKVFGICRTSCLLSVYLFFYVMYLVGGAIVFSILEGPEEKALQVRLDSAVAEFLQAYPAVSGEALNSLIEEVVNAGKRGISSNSNFTRQSNWSFGQSLFFSSTVVTTVGYGQVTPVSKSGKIFCIIYALFGIPMTLVLLSALVERLLYPALNLLKWLQKCHGHSLNIRILHLSIIVAILINFFLLIPAAAYAAIEPGWKYLDALYYCFISLTTIGLGDYIPGDSPGQPYRPLYKIATTCYLYCGITVLMLTLAVFYEIPQLNLGTLLTNNKDQHLEKKPAQNNQRKFTKGVSNSFRKLSLPSCTKEFRLNYV